MPLSTTTEADEAWTALTTTFIGDPAICNWALSAISRNRALDNAGGFRYWLVEREREVASFAVLSAGSGRLDVTPMTVDEAAALAEHVARDVASLRGVLGPASTAAAFAGRWTELAAVGAKPSDGGRVLEVRQLVDPPPRPAGSVRPAIAEDVELLVRWNAGFAADTDAAAPDDPSSHLGRQVDAGLIWMWEGPDGAEAMSVRTPSVFGTRRIAHVYTPLEHRRRGVAAALVAHLAGETLTAGDRCMLHTQLSNPAPNRVYRRLGFEAISESTFYEFLN